MLVGLISDTHDNIPLIRKALARFREAGAEAVVHAGDFIAPFALKEIVKFDGPVYAVFGNNDGERKGLKNILGDLADGPRRVEIAGKTFTIIHDEAKLTEADREGSDVVVLGHTHLPEVREGKPLVVNPGECGGWVEGRWTVATLDTETLEVDMIELDGA